MYSVVAIVHRSTRRIITFNYMHVAEFCSISANTPSVMDTKCSLDTI